MRSPRLLLIALLLSGTSKFALAMTGMGLCVIPFVASGFSYRFGVAFRDGPIAGLLYMFFLPYRIHYRLTHQELFQRLRAPTLKLRDFSLLLLGLCFLPLVILAAQEMEKQPRNQPPAIDWTKVGPGHAIPKPPTSPKHAGKPGPIALARRGARTNAHAPARSDPDAPEATDPNAPTPAPAPAPAPTAPEKTETPANDLADSSASPARAAASKPEAGASPRFGRGLRPPMFPRGPMASRGPMSLRADPCPRADPWRVLRPPSPRRRP